MEEFFKVGIITAAHGLRGEVKVYPTTDDAKRFKRLKEVYFCAEKPVRAGQDSTFSDQGPDASSPILKIDEVKFFKQFVILKFHGIDKIEDAEKYRRGALYVSRENAVRLKKDEYFIADLMGLSVRDEDDTEIGVLKDVLETGANDVYVIALKDGRELLLPAIKQCVLAVDVEAGYIRIHILEGLI